MLILYYLKTKPIISFMIKGLKWYHFLYTPNVNFYDWKTRLLLKKKKLMTLLSHISHVNAVGSMWLKVNTNQSVLMMCWMGHMYTIPFHVDHGLH